MSAPVGPRAMNWGALTTWNVPVFEAGSKV